MDGKSPLLLDTNKLSHKLPHKQPTSTIKRSAHNKFIASYLNLTNSVLGAGVLVSLTAQQLHNNCTTTAQQQDQSLTHHFLVVASSSTHHQLIINSSSTHHHRLIMISHHQRLPF
jgi:hypothetical protein